MKLINEVLWMTELKDLKNEIQTRYEMISTMVGSLYPSIVSDEIRQIESHIKWLHNL